MVFVLTMAAQDNERLSFITLSAATKNVTRYLKLDEKAEEQPAEDSDPRRSDEQRRADNDRDVDKGLREVAARVKVLSRKS